jgi:hypothetical protein
MPDATMSFLPNPLLDLFNKTYHEVMLPRSRHDEAWPTFLTRKLVVLQMVASSFEDSTLSRSMHEFFEFIFSLADWGRVGGCCSDFYPVLIDFWFYPDKMPGDSGSVRFVHGAQLQSNALYGLRGIAADRVGRPCGGCAADERGYRSRRPGAGSDL